VRISIPTDRIADFCRQNSIRRLAVFGSALRDDFGPDSDIDVLVEFQPNAGVGYIRLAGMEAELGEILGHRVDMNTPNGLHRRFRDTVLAEAEVLYAA
jgi:predicted nucleotidyltransferase